MYGTDCGAHALSLLLVYLFMLAFAVNEVDSDMADMKIVHVEGSDALERSEGISSS